MSLRMMVFDAVTSLVGGALSLVAPRAAMQYIDGRLRLRDYVASSTSGPNQRWSPRNTTGDVEVGMGAERVRARVRDLVRNNGLVSGAVQKQVAAIIGTGMRPQAKVLQQDGETLDETLNENIEAAFERWAENAGLSGVSSFYEIQELVLKHLLTDGEILNHDVVLPVKFGNGYRIELLECDHLDTSCGESFNGIDYDNLGRPTTYHLYDQHPGGLWPSSKTVPVPASDIIHLFIRDRVSQRRGVSPLAPVVMELYDMGELMNAELLASRVAAAFAVAVKSKTPGDWTSFIDAGVAGNPPRGQSATVKHQTVPYGQFVYMNKDEEIDVISSNRPNANFEPFLRGLKRDTSCGVGMAYESFTNDYSQSNYSSTRQSLLDERRGYRRRQQYLVRHYLTPIYRKWLRFEVMAGGIPGLTWSRYRANPEAFEAVTFQAPGFEWIDPLKEAEANKILLVLGLTNLTEIAEGLGKDLPTLLKTRAWEKARMQQLGLWDDFVAAVTKGAAPSTPAQQIQA